MVPIKKLLLFSMVILGIIFVFFINRETEFIIKRDSNLSQQNNSTNIQSQEIGSEETESSVIGEQTPLNDEKDSDEEQRKPFNEADEQHKPFNEVNNEKTSDLEQQKAANNLININPFEFRTTPKPMAIMLFGVDRTKDEVYGRSDSIMLALVQPRTKELMLISIPRDTYVEIPGFGFHKLNTAFQLGGAELTKETVENWLELQITDTVSIDYANFEELVDLIGGIEINVDRRMAHDEFILEKGLQTLSGKEALYFVRFRKSLDGNHDSDYKRTERQRQVLSKLTDELLKTRSFTQSFSLLRSLLVTVDTTLSIQKIITYGHHYSDFTSENISALSFKGEGARRDGLWYEIISEDELAEKKQLIYEFMNKQEEELLD